MFNKRSAIDIGGFHTRYRYIVDYDFFIRMGEQYALYGSKEILSKWRVHEKQATKVMGKVVFDEQKKLIFDFLKKGGAYRKITIVLLFRYVIAMLKSFAHSLISVFRREGREARTAENDFGYEFVRRGCHFV